MPFSLTDCRDFVCFKFLACIVIIWSIHFSNTFQSSRLEYCFNFVVSSLLERFSASSNPVFSWFHFHTFFAQFLEIYYNILPSHLLSNPWTTKLLLFFFFSDLSIASFALVIWFWSYIQWFVDEMLISKFVILIETLPMIEDY